MIQEFQGEADQADSARLGDIRVPSSGQGSDLRQGCQGEPTEGDGHGYQESGEAIWGADLDGIQGEAAFWSL